MEYTVPIISNNSPDEDRFQSGVEWSEDSKNTGMQQMTSSFVAVRAETFKYLMLKSLSSLGP